MPPPGTSSFRAHSQISCGLKKDATAKNGSSCFFLKKLAAGFGFELRSLIERVKPMGFLVLNRDMQFTEVGGHIPCVLEERSQQPGTPGASFSDRRICRTPPQASQPAFVLTGRVRAALCMGQWLMMAGPPASGIWSRGPGKCHSGKCGFLPGIELLPRDTNAAL